MIAGSRGKNSLNVRALLIHRRHPPREVNGGGF
jgi:hypothetical protein